MDDVYTKIDLLLSKTRECYRIITNPLHTLEKIEIIRTLGALREALEKISKEIGEANRGMNLQYVSELNPKKLDLFHQNFLMLANKVNKHLFIELHKKEITNDLLNIKEAITRPQGYYDLEEEVKNELNIFIQFLEGAKKIIENKYVDIGAQKRSSEQLMTLVSQKDNKILNLNKQLEEYRWLEAKEKMVASKISNLESELISKTKVTEQNQTLLKIHIVHLEQELANIYRHIKQLNNDITNLDNSQLEKERIALELIKELKDELLTTRYALTKASHELKKNNTQGNI